MSKAKRNHAIVEHLRLRFKERYNIELTRDRRISLLNQINKNIGQLTTVIKLNTELWRVEIYNQATYCNQSFIVMYDRAIDQIRTVLPPVDSEEFDEFCERVHISKEQLLNQQLTAKERTHQSVDKAIKHREKQAIIKEGLQRLDSYKTFADYIKKNA